MLMSERKLQGERWKIFTDASSSNYKYISQVIGGFSFIYGWEYNVACWNRNILNAVSNIAEIRQQSCYVYSKHDVRNIWAESL